MRLIKILCITILAWSAFPGTVFSQENVPIKEQEAQLKALLVQLDNIIEDSDKYENRRLAKIDAIRNRMSAAPQDSSEYYHDSLFSLFYAFQSDSALYYSRKGIQQSKLHGNDLMLIKSKVNLAKIYQMTGNYHACISLLDNIERKNLPWDVLVNMLAIYNGVYDALTATAIDKELQSLYYSQAISYKDSILAVDPDNIFVKCDRLLIDLDISSAVSLLRPFCDRLELADPLTGPSAYALSDVYRRQNLPLQERIYLAISAISDLVNGNKEYMSLTRLARLLYDYTPGIFQTRLSYNDRKNDQWARTTLARQLALYLTMYSPIQMACDLPENYRRFPDAHFKDNPQAYIIKTLTVSAKDNLRIKAAPGGGYAIRIVPAPEEKTSSRGKTMTINY